MSRNYDQLRQRVETALPDYGDSFYAHVAFHLEKALALMDVVFGAGLEKKDPQAAAAFLAPLMQDALREASDST